MKINFINRVDIYFLTASTLILSLMLFYSVSSDLSAFIQGGMILHNGGSLYVDYFDVKPPFVYYFFEFLYSFMGKNIFLYRLFDVLYQLTFLISFIYIFKKLSLESKYIRTFLILMPISYIILNNFNVLQMESLLNLPLLFYFYLTVAKNNTSLKNILLKGLLLGIMINLKYTFGILILADVFILFRKQKSLKSISYGTIVQLIIALLFTLICFSPILLNGHIGEFLNFMGYMKAYTSNPPFSLEHFKVMINAAIVFFTDSYSIVLLLCTIFAIFIFGKKKYKLNQININDILVYILLLFITVVIERKMLAYHEQRIYLPLILLASIGFVILLEKVKQLNYISIILIAFVGLIFSPIPRLVNILKLPYYKIMKQEDNYYYYFVDGISGHILYKQYLLSKYVNSNFNTDKLLLVDTGGNELVVFMEKDYKYSFPQSAFYLVNIAPDYLVQRAFKDLKDADVVIVQKNDNLPIMFFNDDNSLTALKKRKPLWDYLNTNFKQDTVIAEDFLIFIRNRADIK